MARVCGLNNCGEAGLLPRDRFVQSHVRGASTCRVSAVLIFAAMLGRPCVIDSCKAAFVVRVHRVRRVCRVSAVLIFAARLGRPCVIDSCEAPFRCECGRDGGLSVWGSTGRIIRRFAQVEHTATTCAVSIFAAGLGRPCVIDSAQRATRCRVCDSACIRPQAMDGSRKLGMRLCMRLGVRIGTKVRWSWWRLGVRLC